MADIPTNKQDISVAKVDYYLIAPFRIHDWNSFEKGLSETSAKKLDDGNTRNKESLKDHLLMFLGLMGEGKDPIISAGTAYQANFQDSNDRFLSTWKSDIRFVKPNNEEYPIANPIAQPEQTMDLFIAPNRACGIAMLPLSGKQTTMSEVVEMNYLLHKTDSKQAPKMKRRSGFDKTTRTPIWSDMEVTTASGETHSGTLLDIFEHAMPSQGYVWENPNRLIMATCVSIDSSDNLDRDSVTRNIISIGQAKSDAYQFAWNSVGTVTELYANILAYATPEGLACCVLNDQGDNAGDFIRNFGSDAFRKSYLPIFLSTVMADLVITSAIRNLDKVARNAKEQNLVREAQLAVTLAPSHYEHLIRLMGICKDGRQFDDKASTIRDHIEARRMQLESNVNYILGFIGVGQVVFAILQLTGVNYIFGERFGTSAWAKWTVILTGIVFTIAILLYIVRLIGGKGRKQ